MRLKSTVDLFKQMQDLANQLEESKVELVKARAKARGVAQLADLREEVEALKLERARMLEDFDRKNRELSHKIGLERKRQEFEVETAKREAMVAVREENLSADRDRFDEQMAFEKAQFDTQVTYLQDLMEKVLSRLPTVKVGEVGQVIQTR